MDKTAVEGCARERIGTDGQLLKPCEVAQYLNVNPRTLLRWVREKRIAAVRLSDQTVRFHRADIEALIAGRSLREVMH